MLKVAQIFLTLPVGGAEDLVVSLFPEWERVGVDQTIVCLRDLGVLGEELTAAGRPFQLVRCAPTRRWNLLGILRLARWLRRSGIEVVHSHVYNSHQYAIPAAALVRLPVLVHHHKTFNPRQGRKNWVLKQLDRWSTRHVCLAESTRADLIANLGILPGKIEVLANGVPAEFRAAENRDAIRARLGLDAATTVLGNVASLNPQKNQGMLVDLAQRLRKEMPSVQFIICGEGPLRPALESQIRAAGLGREVKLAGNQRPIGPWLQSFDVFLFPSTWEGQPLALIQAMACGVPILASRIEGNVAALGVNHPGLIELSDLAEWERRIKEVLANNAYRRAIIDHQAARKQKYTLDRYADELKKIYQSMLSR